MYRPQNRIFCPAVYLICVGEVQLAADIRPSGIAVQKHRQLFPRHLSFRLKSSVSDAARLSVRICPLHRFKVPLIRLYIGKYRRFTAHFSYIVRLFCLIVQNLRYHAARHGSIWRKRCLRCSLHDAIFIHVLHIRTKPVLCTHIVKNFFHFSRYPLRALRKYRYAAREQTQRQCKRCPSSCKVIHNKHPLSILPLCKTIPLLYGILYHLTSYPSLFFQ